MNLTSPTSKIIDRLADAHYRRIDTIAFHAFLAAQESWASSSRNGGFWRMLELRTWMPDHTIQRVSDRSSYHVSLPKVKAVLRWRWS